jgi:hypothetical protein
MEMTVSGIGDSLYGAALVAKEERGIREETL